MLDDDYAYERSLMSKAAGPSRLRRSQQSSCSDSTAPSSGDKFRSSSSAGAEGVPTDLCRLMRERIATLEKSIENLKGEALTKDAKLVDLQRTQKSLLSQLDSVTNGAGDSMLTAYRTALKENARLRSQVAEMEKFLSDYGLTWVGGSTNSQAGTDSESTSASQIPPPLYDVDLLLKRMAELNRVMEEERGTIITKGNRAKFSPPENVPITIYQDCIVVGTNGVLRPFSETPTQLFVRDILDGYFPSEFKRDYPDGFVISAKDRRREYGVGGGARVAAFSGPGHKLGGHGVPEEAELAVGGGAGAALAIIAARNNRKAGERRDLSAGTEIEQCSGSALGSEESVEESSEYDRSAVTIQVKCPDLDKMLVIKLKPYNTIEDLKREILHKWPTAARFTGCAPAFEIRTAFPAKLHADLTQTLEESGLTPNGTVMLRRLDSRTSSGVQ